MCVDRERREGEKKEGEREREIETKRERNVTVTHTVWLSKSPRSQTGGELRRSERVPGSFPKRSGRCS